MGSVVLPRADMGRPAGSSVYNGAEFWPADL